MNVRTGGVAGYLVVDPMPTPYICPAPGRTWFTGLDAQWDTHLGIVVRIQLTNALSGVTLENVTVNPLVRVDRIETTLAPSVRISVPDDDWPEAVDLHLFFVCDGVPQRERYELRVRLFTGMPAMSGAVPFEYIDDDADAGT